MKGVEAVRHRPLGASPQLGVWLSLEALMALLLAGTGAVIIASWIVKRGSGEADTADAPANVLPAEQMRDTALRCAQAMQTQIQESDGEIERVQMLFKDAIERLIASFTSINQQTAAQQQLAQLDPLQQ